MLLDRRLQLLYLGLALAPILGAVACRSDSLGPQDSEDVGVRSGGTRRASLPTTVLRGELAAIFAMGYARSLADYGNRELLEYFERTSNPAPEVDGLLTYLTPEDGEPARIDNPNTSIQVSADQATMIASMSFTGSYGSNTITGEAVTLDGGALATDIDPVEDGKWSPVKILPCNLTTVVNVTLPNTCGLEMRASTTHAAWFATVPVPLPLWEVFPWMKWGEVGATSQNAYSQYPCGYSGGGGGGGGTLMGVYECYYTDYYDGNWNYLFTSFEGCVLVSTYWNQT